LTKNTLPTILITCHSSVGVYYDPGEKNQASLIDTFLYHLISRCVRRVFLCGKDKYSGQNFEHRRQWMVDRIRFLTSVFAIRVAAYAEMSNHYHIVAHVKKVRQKPRARKSPAAAGNKFSPTIFLSLIGNKVSVRPKQSEKPYLK
jgi:hypothetical protein